MITYEKYLKYGGKRDVTAFWELQDRRAKIRCCALDIAHYKKCMQDSTDRNADMILTEAIRYLGRYSNDESLHKMLLQAIYELAALSFYKFHRSFMFMGYSISGVL